MTDGFTRYVDVAQISLYVFWVFFAGLVFYLRREDRREGYPLVSQDTRVGRREGGDFLLIPSPKIFYKPDGGIALSPQTEPPAGPIAALPAGRFPGAPLIPTGNPMLDGVGPAAWVDRLDEPDKTLDGDNRIVPLRTVPEYYVSRHSSDPIGWTVVGADGLVAGIVRDLWVDESEKNVRYIEITLDAAVAADCHQVLIPENFVRYRRRQLRVSVRAILASQFADVPVLRHPEEVTFREEDRLVAYFGGGSLYATPGRLGPLL